MGETDVTIKNVTLAIKHVLDFDPNETNPHTVYKNDFIRKKAAELGKSIYEVSGMKARYHRKKAAANTTQP